MVQKSLIEFDLIINLKQPNKDVAQAFLMAFLRVTKSRGIWKNMPHILENGFQLKKKDHTFGGIRSNYIHLFGNASALRFSPSKFIVSRNVWGRFSGFFGSGP